MYQQQMLLDQQNQQLNTLLEEQDSLKRELEHQRFAVEKIRNRKNVESREKELDALAMLDNYSKSVVILFLVLLKSQETQRL